MNLMKLVIAFLCVFGVAAPVMASPEDMEVSTWDPGCEHTMTTNHFELAPGESVEIPLDLTSCDGVHEGILFFGYNTTDISSFQITRRDKIHITVIDQDTGQQWNSDSGYLYVLGSDPASCVMYVENMNRKKTLKVRLRSSVIW